MVKDSKKSTSSGAHEVGHTLGLTHDSKGLMTETSSDSKRTSAVTKSGVSDMIKYPLKGKINNDGNTNAGKGMIKSNNTIHYADELRKGKVN